MYKIVVPQSDVNLLNNIPKYKICSIKLSLFIQDDDSYYFELFFNKNFQDSIEKIIKKIKYSWY